MHPSGHQQSDRRLIHILQQLSPTRATTSHSQMPPNHTSTELSVRMNTTSASSSPTSSPTSTSSSTNIQPSPTSSTSISTSISTSTSTSTSTSILYRTFTHLIKDQHIFIIPKFEFENGFIFYDMPVAYKTWGTLNTTRDNVLIVCHALTGSSDVSSWWSDLMGPGRVFDANKYFIICCNVLGSPYGSASPVTINKDTGKPYQSDFPLVTIRDTVRAHRHVLDSFGITSVRFAIGASLGGMQVLEWGVLFGSEYVRALIVIASVARQGAWSISWSEIQRRTIHLDPNYNHGKYTPHHEPDDGLATARMCAMISYRSEYSFEQRFGRTIQDKGTYSVHKRDKGEFAVQSYLRYQGRKFVERFDANCYLSLVELMDTHDISRGRGELPTVLASIKQPVLLFGIITDILYPLTEQELMARHLPSCEFHKLDSDDGHDGFLIKFDEVTQHCLKWLQHLYPDLYQQEKQN